MRGDEMNMKYYAISVFTFYVSCQRPKITGIIVEYESGFITFGVVFFGYYAAMDIKI